MSKVLKRMFLATAMAMIAGAGSAYAVPENAGHDANGYYVAGRLLVQPRAGVEEQVFKNAIAAEHAQVDRKIYGMETMIVRVPVGQEQMILERLQKNPHVDFAELDRIVEPDFTPDDPLYASQWHHAKMGSELAWDITQGDSNLIVAILDTGMDSAHPDLAAHMVSGWNTSSNSSDTSDIHGHGTTTGGSAAAIGNNALGVSGVAPNVKIMPIRVTDNTSGSASTSAIAAGVNWARDHGAKVANISYQYLQESSTVISAAQGFYNNGGLVFHAASNTGGLLSGSDTPYMIAVGATTSSDVRASWSSYGDYVDMAAPGAGIYTTSRGGGYTSASGTSYSSPVAAGLAALIFSVNPALSPFDVETIIETTAVDLGDPGYDIYFGNGRIDSAAAVTLAQTYAPTQNDTQAPNVSIASPAANATVAGTAVVDVTATDNVGVTKVDLFVNGAFYATDNTVPYSFAWDTVPHGNADVTLTAKAYDAVGNNRTSTGVPVKVRNIVDMMPPLVTIMDPADGTTLSGRNATITANATDNLGVNQMNLYIDDSLEMTSFGGSLSYNWNLRKVSDGSHTIRVEAVDLSDNIGTAIITVIKGGTTGGGGGGGKGGGKPTGSNK